MVVHLEKTNWKISQQIPTIKCPSKITEAKALKDYFIEDFKKRSGDYHCFCKNMLEKDGSSKTINFKFKLDKGKRHCKEWISTQNLISFLA